MKKFQFPLERVRHFRELQLGAERAKLEACAARIRQIDEAAAALAAEKTEAVASLHSGGEALVYERFAAFADHSDRTRRQLVSLRQQAVTAFERQKAAVTAARQKLEVLEKCKERALEEWKSDFAREQEDLASELFLAATARRMRTERRGPATPPEDSAPGRSEPLALPEPPPR